MRGEGIEGCSEWLSVHQRQRDALGMGEDDQNIEAVNCLLSYLIMRRDRKDSAQITGVAIDDLPPSLPSLFSPYIIRAGILISPSIQIAHVYPGHTMC